MKYKLNKKKADEIRLSPRQRPRKIWKSEKLAIQISDFLLLTALNLPEKLGITIFGDFVNACLSLCLSFFWSVSISFLIISGTCEGVPLSLSFLKRFHFLYYYFRGMCEDVPVSLSICLKRFHILYYIFGEYVWCAFMIIWKK